MLQAFRHLLPTVFESGGGGGEDNYCKIKTKVYFPLDADLKGIDGVVDEYDERP